MFIKFRMRFIRQNSKSSLNSISGKSPFDVTILHKILDVRNRIILILVRKIHSFQCNLKFNFVSLLQKLYFLQNDDRKLVLENIKEVKRTASKFLKTLQGEFWFESILDFEFSQILGC